MARSASFALAVALTLGIGGASAQTGGKAQFQSVTGVVKAASISSLTIDRGGTEITFVVTSSTRVVARGTARTAPRDLVWRNPDPARSITKFVKPGDRVTVKYRGVATPMLAVEVRVVQE